MCSIGEADYGDEGGLHTMTMDYKAPTPNNNFGTCSKCESQGSLIKLRFRESECNNCFIQYVHHKFRATLGSSKIVPKNAEVLLVFDGTPASLALLHMMHCSQTQNIHKRLHVNTKVLFIDESCLNSNLMNAHEARSLLSKYNFETLIMSVNNEKSLRRFTSLDSELDESATDKEFSLSFKTATSRADFLKVHRRNLIEKAANEVNCNYVFLPEISTTLAMELLNSIALGRGASVALDVSLLDDRPTDVKFVRPLRTVNKEELDYYIKANELEVVNQSNGYKFESSIQNLTHRFVEDLQNNYSSTISTIFRTGDKIAPRGFSQASCTKCALCKSNLIYEPSHTLEAIEFSRLVSTTAAKPQATNGYNTTHDSFKPNNQPALCHACLSIQKDCKVDLIR